MKKIFQRRKVVVVVKVLVVKMVVEVEIVATRVKKKNAKMMIKWN
jgi:hypothetical protein